MASCLGCGHPRISHTDLDTMRDCAVKDCTCRKFEPAGGGEAIADVHPTGQRGSGAHVTGPATDAPTAVAGPRPALSYGCTCPGGDTHDPANPACRYGQVAAVRPPDLESNFYEDDEPIEKIMAAFEAGEKGVTAPPAGCRCGHDVDAHIGSFATGQHCNACPAWEPCACCEPPAYTPDPVDATPVTLAAARGALERAKRLEKENARYQALLRDAYEVLHICRDPWCSAPDHIDQDEGFKPCPACDRQLTDAQVKAAEMADRIDAALATDPPARGRAVLNQVERLRALTGPDRTRRVVGYQTADGRLYHPEDVAIVYETQVDAALDLGAAPEEAGGD